MRRLRRHDWSRRLIAENVLTAADFIWPLFVIAPWGADRIVPVEELTPGLPRDLLGLLRIADDPPRPRMECAEPFKKSELPSYYELKFETNVERCAHPAESCSPEKVNNWEVLCEVGGRPGCDGFFSQGYRGDLSRWRGESSKKGVVQGESRRFVGGDFVVNQYRVAFA